MREKQKHSGPKLNPNHKSSWNRLLNFNSEIIKIYFTHIYIDKLHVYYVYIYITSKNTQFPITPKISHLPNFLFIASVFQKIQANQTNKNGKFFDPDEKCPRSPRLPSFEVFVAIEGVTGSSLKSARGVGHDGCMPFWKTTRKVGPPQKKGRRIGDIFVFVDFEWKDMKIEVYTNICCTMTNLEQHNFRI